MRTIQQKLRERYKKGNREVIWFWNMIKEVAGLNYVSRKILVRNKHLYTII